MSFTIQDICDEIASINGMLVARAAKVKSDLMKEKLESKLAISIASKIGKLGSVTLSTAKDLYDAVDSCGASDASCTVLVAAIDSKLEEAIEDEDEKVAKASTRNQLATNPRAWVTNQLVTSLQGPAPIDTKIQILGEYMASKGLRKVHEQTYKHWLCMLILLHYTGAFPSYKLIFQHLAALKKAVKSVTQKFPLPLKPKLPRLPSELGEQELGVYFPTDPPVVLQLERYENVLGHIPLRKDNALLVAEEKELQAQAASSRVQFQAGASSQPVVHHVGHVLQPSVQASPETADWAKDLMQQNADNKRKLLELQAELHASKAQPQFPQASRPQFPERMKPKLNFQDAALLDDPIQQK